MNIDFSPILSSARYKTDQEKLKITGKQRARTIYFYLFLLFTVVAWPYLIYKAGRYFLAAGSTMASRDESLRAFALANDFEYTNHIKNIQPLTEDQLVRGMDLPFKSEYVVSMNDLQGNLLGYHFKYTLSSIGVKIGNEVSQYPSIIFTIDLPVTLPRMFMNSKVNDMSQLDAEATNFAAAEDHQLEGNFPDYYTVRIEKNEQIDMYVTLTPEVMQTLITNNQYDVWLNGSQLMFITFGDQARYFAGTPVVFSNAITLMKEIDKVARALRTHD